MYGAAPRFPPRFPSHLGGRGSGFRYSPAPHRPPRAQTGRSIPQPVLGTGRREPGDGTDERGQEVGKCPAANLLRSHLSGICYALSAFKFADSHC